MKKLIFFQLLYLQTISIYTQQDKFNKTFYFTNDIITMTSIIPADSGYVLSGMYYGEIAVCLVDSDVNLKWLKLFSDTALGHSLGYVPDNFKKTSDDSYIAVATIQNGLASFSRIGLMKLDSLFNERYIQGIVDETSCDGCLSGKYVFEDTNGNYVILGESARDSLNNFFLDKIGNGILIKTDTSGNKLNYKHYGGPLNYHDWFNTGLQLGNYYYLFGATRSYAPAYVTGFDRTDGWVVKTDLQGNEVASAAFGNPNLYEMDFRYALSLSGNKLLTGQYYSYEKNGNGFLMTKPWLLILNDDLSINKECFFRNASISGDTLFSIGFMQGVLNTDSSMAFLGIDASYNMNLYEVIRKEATITVLDKKFNVLYNRSYIHQGNVFNNINPYTIAPASDGGYIFGGYVVDMTLLPVQQSWLVKTDSLGCDGFTSCNDTALVCQILQAPDTSCKNDTAWLQVRFKGRSAPYFVYADTTLALDSVYYPYTLPLWIDTLVPFVPKNLGLQDVIVSVYDPWGWQQSDTVQVFVKNCGTGSVAETWYPKKVEIFPNPATNELHVKIRATITEPVTVTIYDMQGKVVKEITTKGKEMIIGISELGQGVYGVRVVGNNINVSERLIKM